MHIRYFQNIFHFAPCCFSWFSFDLIMNYLQFLLFENSKAREILRNTQTKHRKVEWVIGTAALVFVSQITDSAHGACCVLRVALSRKDHQLNHKMWWQCRRWRRCLQLLRAAQHSHMQSWLSVNTHTHAYTHTHIHTQSQAIRVFEQRQLLNAFFESFLRELGERSRREVGGGRLQCECWHHTDCCYCCGSCCCW